MVHLNGAMLDGALTVLMVLMKILILAVHQVIMQMIYVILLKIVKMMQHVIMVLKVHVNMQLVDITVMVV